MADTLCGMTAVVRDSNWGKKMTKKVGKGESNSDYLDMDKIQAEIANAARVPGSGITNPIVDPAPPLFDLIRASTAAKEVSSSFQPMSLVWEGKGETNVPAEPKDAEAMPIEKSSNYFAQLLVAFVTAITVLALFFALYSP